LKPPPPLSLYLSSYGDFQAFCRAKKNRTYITKPESGSQGKGIFVFKNPREIKPGEHCIVQQYVSKVSTE
jgi:tubulin polyglutamylase TTLL6/13